MESVPSNRSALLDLRGSSTKRAATDVRVDYLGRDVSSKFLPLNFRYIHMQLTSSATTNYSEYIIQYV